MEKSLSKVDDESISVSKNSSGTIGNSSMKRKSMKKNSTSLNAVSILNMETSEDMSVSESDGSGQSSEEETTVSNQKKEKSRRIPHQCNCKKGDHVCIFFKLISILLILTIEFAKFI